MDIMWSSMVSWAGHRMSPPPPPLRQFAAGPAMALPRVTEDTPPDLLEGEMDLTVILPAGLRVNMSVHRSTPMMDLLIQVTTAHKINPGGHVIHLVSDNRLLTYKPSTPIGTLDTSVIKIVAKNRLNDEARTRRAHLVTQQHEKNIRLKVNLPRSQLAVYRVPPRTQISEVLAIVCGDRGIDVHTHEIRHPVNVDEKLRGSCTLADYQLQEVSLVPRDYQAPPLSVTDLITMAAINTGARDSADPKRRGLLSLFSRKAKSSTGESSLSSGSAGERSVSPARSDVSEGGGGGGGGSNSSLPPPPHHHQIPSSMPPASTSSSSSTLTPFSSTSTSAAPPLPRPRKRQAPAPPPPGETNGKESLRMDHGGDEGGGGGGGGRAPVSLSRCSSSSSGYQEPLRSPQTSPAESEVSEVTQRPHHHHMTTTTTTTTSTNLTSTSSSSSLSLASRGKRRAPPPPKPLPAPPQPIPEEGEAPPTAPPATSTPAKATEASKQESEASDGSEGDSRPQSPPSPLPPVPPSPSSSSSSSCLSYEEEKVTSTSSSTAAAAAIPPPPDAAAPAPPPPAPSTLPSSSSSSTSTSTQPSELNLHQYLHHHSTTTNLLHHHSSTNHHPPPPPQHPSSTTTTTSSRGGGQMEEFKRREGASSTPLRHHHHQVSTNRVAGSGGGGGGRGGRTSPEIPQKDARIPQDASRLQEIAMDLQQIPQKDARLPQDLQETPQDTSKLNRNLQKIERELQEIPQDPQIMPHVALRKRKEAPRVPQETLPVPQNAPTVMPRSHVPADRQADRRVGETRRMINSGNSRELDGNGKNRENDRTARNSYYTDSRVDKVSRSNSSSNNSVSSISSSDSRRAIPTFRMVTQTQTKMNAKNTHTKTHAVEARMFLADGVTHGVQEGESASPSASRGGSVKGLAAKILGKNAGKSSGSLGKISKNADRNSGSLGKMSKNTDRNSGSFGKMSKNADMNSESLWKIFGTSEGSPGGWQKPTGEAGGPRGSDESDESDLEFNEDMFEPRYLLGGNLSPHDPSDLTPKTSTPDQRGVGQHPQPLQPLLPPTSPLSPASPPQPPPRGMAHRKRAPMPPPESEKAGISGTAKWDEYPVSPAPPSAPTEEEEEEKGRLKRLKEGQEGQYLSHFSRLCEIDAELLSLLSEEGVDSTPPSLSRHPSSVSSTHATLTEGQEGAALPQRASPDNVPLPRGQTIQTVPQEKTSQIGPQRASPDSMALISDQKTKAVPQKPGSNAMSHPKALPPTSAVPAQSSASSYRAGYLAMLAKLHEDDDTVGIETKSTKNTLGSTENALGYTENTPGCFKAVTQDTGIVTSSRSSAKVPEGDESADVRKKTHHHHQSNTISTTSSTTSLLSDSDHEVQTHRASFSSESSDEEEENSDHGDGDAHSSDDSSSGPPSPPLEHKIQHPLLVKPSQGDGDAHSSDESPPASPPPQLQKPKKQDTFPKKSKNAQNSVDSRENGVGETWEPLPGRRQGVKGSNREFGNTDKVHSQVIPEVLTAGLRKKEDEEEEGKIGGTRDRSPSCSSSSSSSSSSSESSKEEEEEEEDPSLSWAFPLPDPPTPFQDHPSPPSAGDSGSEGARDASSARDTHSAGAKGEGEGTSTPPLKLPSLPEDQQRRRRRRRRRRDSSSSSSVSAASSSSTEGEGGEEERKRNMINELRTAIREPRPEPRVVALKPKATVVYESRPAAPTHTHTPGAAPAPSTAPPTRPKASHKRDEPWASYESCEDAHSLRRSRSSSATSYDSAPPPLPDAPAPPATSSGGAARVAVSYKPPAVSFSISTYKSRAEETSYDKKVVKTDSSASATPITPSAAPTTTTTTTSTTPPITTAATTKPVLPEKPFFREFSTGSRFSHAPPRWVPKPSEGERRATPFRYPAAPRRIQRGVSQLGRTASLGNLSVLERNLRRAQSSHDLYAGDSTTAPGDMQGVGGGNSAAPGAGGGGNFGGGGGMPFLPMGGGGMMGEAGLADEFMKLQQDFFKWQQQLLQNQHVLHSRVAPLANNPPQLQSVGVIRDILGQGPSNGSPQEVTEARNPSMGMGGAGGRRQPVERIINIRFEEGPSETSESELHGPTFSRTGPIPDMTRDMAQMTTGPRPQQQQQPTRRWEEPSVSVGAWRDRPATQPSQDTSTYAPMPSPTPITPQPLSQPVPQLVPQPMSQQRMSPRPQGPRGYSRPADSAENSTRPYQWPPAASSDLPAPPQQFQSLPPEQKQQFAQFIQQQQQPTWPPKQQEQQQQFTQQSYQPQPLQQQYQPPLQQPPQPQQQPQPSQLQPQQATWPPKQPSPQPQQPDRAAFWQELESKRQGLGLGQDEEEGEPGRPARRGSRQDSPTQYYYNGDTTTQASAGGGSGGPRYTSVVTVASDGPEAAARDNKVRSVLQLNTEQPPRPAPVVRGFRQPGEEPGLPSRLLGSAASARARSSASPPVATNGLEAPAAARLVGAASATPPQRATPPRASPPRASPPQSFPGVQLRPVPSRASPPSEAIQPPVAAAAPPPPPAPPAPPMAPPPPPAPTMPQGERRTSTGKKIVSPKTGAELDAREELMMAIRGHGGMKALRRTHIPPPQ